DKTCQSWSFRIFIFTTVVNRCVILKLYRGNLQLSKLRFLFLFLTFNEDIYFYLKLHMYLYQNTQESNQDDNDDLEQIFIFSSDSDLKFRYLFQLLEINQGIFHISKIISLFQCINYQYQGNFIVSIFIVTSVALDQYLFWMNVIFCLPQILRFEDFDIGLVSIFIKESMITSLNLASCVNLLTQNFQLENFIWYLLAFNCVNSVFYYKSIIDRKVSQDPSNNTPLFICQECVQGFIVNYDFRSCIYQYQLPMAFYSFCRRLDRYKSCDEAHCTIQINQNGQFLTENPLQYDRRCAKIDTINKICISPRFPYTLDIDNNQIVHIPNNYCKIKDRNNCLQNHETFYFSNQYQTYFSLSNFINLNLLDMNVVSKEDLKCIYGYKYVPSQSLTQKDGCFPLQFNCDNDGIKCICKNGEALEVSGYSCLSYEGCAVFEYLINIKYCIQCSKGYFKNGQYQQDCTPYSNIGNNGQSSQYLWNQFTCSQLLPGQTINGCTQYYNGQCLECQGFEVFYSYQDYNKFQSFCSQSSFQTVQNCKVFQNDECIVCKETYVLSQNQCIQGSIQNCLLYDGSGNCLNCQLGYLLNQNQCLSFPNNCAQYQIVNSAVYCSRCEYNYYLFQDFKNQIFKCFTLGTVLPNKNCVYFNQDGSCKLCYSAHYIDSKDNSQCISEINQFFCLEFDKNNVCQICQSNYILIDGICYYTSQFEKIYSMFYWQNDSQFPFQSSCFQYFSFITWNAQSVNSYKYSCQAQNQISFCKYQTLKGFYLSDNFQYQFCSFTYQLNYCNNCFKGFCLDPQDDCKLGYGWSQTFKKCFKQCLNDVLLINYSSTSNQICNYQRMCDILFDTNTNKYQCSNCSLVSDIKDCQTKQELCQFNQFFSIQNQKCMSYCGNGLIAQNNKECSYSQTCQDGLVWNQFSQNCIYLQCENQRIAVYESCSKSSIKYLQQMVFNQKLDEMKVTDSDQQQMQEESSDLKTINIKYRLEQEQQIEQVQQKEYYEQEKQQN
ncbi:hypothetical protein ABPG72_020198, partial [Tetrahymena utriculariae]